MKPEKSRTRWMRSASLLLGALGLVVVTANSASAQTIKTYGAYEGGGWGAWSQDPGTDQYGDATPGDSIQACDSIADGWGIEVRLDIGRDGDIDRTVSTRGHSSFYCSAWKTGNIAEDTPIRMWVVKVKGDTSYHPVYWDGHA
ncbi:hypothetical protein [Streptomyces sp. NBC_00670]|uniref:hypothetical protein n=1 Tax=Streptomyces sp. NBC_00670 TaxID=2975804 RepID=UPI002E367B65|nr:hypothetical protein [Streptomyces sp. NBC_00670]